MIRRIRPSSCTLAVLLITVMNVSAVYGQLIVELKGRRVVTKQGVELREEIPTRPETEFVGPPGIDWDRIGIGKVTRVLGDWLEFRDDQDGETGWVAKSEVVALEHAVAHATTRIKEDPGHAGNYMDRALIYRELAKDQPTNSGLPVIPAVPEILPAEKLPIKGTPPQIEGLLQALEASRNPFALRLDPPDFAGLMMADLDRAIQLAPDFYDALLVRGWAWEGRGDVEKAMADYSSAIRLAPDDPEGYEYRGHLASELGDFRSAVADYSKVVALDPNSANAFSALGAARARSGDHDGAIADYEKALSLQPRDTDTLRSYGLAWAAKGDHDRAISEFTRALTFEPRNARLFAVRGTSWAAKKDHPRAIADFSEAIRLDPNEPTYLSSRAWSHRENKDYPSAINDLRSALALTPMDADLKRNLGVAYYLQGRKAEAIDILKHTILPNFPGSEPSATELQQLATTYLSLREFERGIDCYTRAIRLMPGRADLLEQRGVAWLMKKDYDKAIGDARSAIELDPANADAYLLRATARGKKGQSDEAIADYGEALALNRNFIVALLGRAGEWYRQGLYEKAYADLEAATKIAPRDPQVLCGRAVLFAICPDARFRHAAKALQAGKLGYELSGEQDARGHGAYAIALAENGSFDQAIQHISKAIELYPDEDSREKSREKLRLFQAGKPYRRLPGDD
jgi:tetratricopeptide (TPR) repeat protein